MEEIKVAQQLGELIKNSEQFKRMSLAEVMQNNDMVAQSLIAAYNQKRDEIGKKIQEEKPPQEVVDVYVKEVQEQFEILLKNEILKEFVDATNAFDTYYKNIQGVIEHSITGKATGCDTSKCGGCSGCN